MNRLYQFMQGRYGIDRLNKHILYFSWFVLFVSIIFQIRFLRFVVYFLLFVYMYRMFSKKTYVRYQENQRYELFIKPYERKVKVMKKNFTDKQYKYYICSSCGQMVRVPKGRGRIEITCPKCHHQFIKKT